MNSLCSGSSSRAPGGQPSLTSQPRREVMNLRHFRSDWVNNTGGDVVFYDVSVAVGDVINWDVHWEVKDELEDNYY